MRSCDHIGNDGVELICYADDMIAIIKAKTAEETTDIGNRALAAIKCWIDANELQMTPEKTAAVVFSWSCKHRADVKLKIDNHEIRPSKCAKYLGVTLDFNLSFTSHVNELMRRPRSARYTARKTLENSDHFNDRCC